MDIGRQVSELSRAAQEIVANATFAELRNTASLKRIAEYLPKLVTAGATEDLATKVGQKAACRRRHR